MALEEMIPMVWLLTNLTREIFSIYHSVNANLPICLWTHMMQGLLTVLENRNPSWFGSEPTSKDNLVVQMNTM